MTTTNPAQRTPHAIQAGATPTLLWVLTLLLDLVNTVIAMVIPWAIGMDLAKKEITWPTVALAGILMLISGIQSLLRRAINIRVPGGLRSYTRDELPQRPTVIPNVISRLSQAVAIIVVGTWSLDQRASGDHGYTVGMIALLAGAMLLLRLIDALTPVFSKEPQPLRAVALAAPEALASAFLVLVALGIDRPHATNGLIFAGTLTLLMSIWKFISRGPRSFPVRESLDEISDKVLNHMNPAPTLEGRDKARVLTRTIALAVAVLVVVVMLLQ